MALCDGPWSDEKLIRPGSRFSKTMSIYIYSLLDNVVNKNTKLRVIKIISS